MLRFEAGTRSGHAVNELLSSDDGLLGCARTRGALGVVVTTGLAWVLVERGRGTIVVDGVVHDVDERTSVFDAPGWSALLARGSAIAIEGDLDCVFVWRSEGDFSAFDEADWSTRVIDRREVGEVSRGDGATQRLVRTYVARGGLIVGETLNPPGGWSSWPPHHHAHEELYSYRFRPESGFGVHVDLGGEPRVVRDGDVVRIRSGEHPVVAAPNALMYYLWALAGDAPEPTTIVDDVWR